MKPFGDHAPALRKRGLAVIPCGGEDGKTPMLKGWQKRKLPVAIIEKLALRYPDANIGIVCGLSGVVNVDIDDPKQLPDMLMRFGDTPLIARTPSGGYHLWYAAQGMVRSTNSGAKELAVDVKADRGLVIVPPSCNPQMGKDYTFERGSWDFLNRLPPFRVEALPRTQTMKASKSSTPAAPRLAERHSRKGNARRHCFLPCHAGSPIRRQ